MPKTAKDIMQSQVVTVSPDAPLHSTQRLFYEEGIQGAPVVDEQGRVVGMITSTDILRAATEAEGRVGEAGLGGAGLVAAGGAAYVAGMGIGAAALGATGSAAAAGVVAVGAIVAAPVLVAGGILRGANNGKVAAEIENRHTHLPLTLAADGEAALDIFFPISPSPIRIEINYSESGDTHLLTINTAEALDGLHLQAPEQEDKAMRDR